MLIVGTLGKLKKKTKRLSVPPLRGKYFEPCDAFSSGPFLSNNISEIFIRNLSDSLVELKPSPN